MIGRGNGSKSELNSRAKQNFGVIVVKYEIISTFYRTKENLDLVF